MRKIDRPYWPKNIQETFRDLMPRGVAVEPAAIQNPNQERQEEIKEAFQAGKPLQGEVTLGDRYHQLKLICVELGLNVDNLSLSSMPATFSRNLDVLFETVHDRLEAVAEKLSRCNSLDETRAAFSDTELSQNVLKSSVEGIYLEFVRSKISNNDRYQDPEKVRAIEQRFQWAKELGIFNPDEISTERRHQAQLDGAKAVAKEFAENPKLSLWSLIEEILPSDELKSLAENAFKQFGLHRFEWQAPNNTKNAALFERLKNLVGPQIVEEAKDRDWHKTANALLNAIESGNASQVQPFTEHVDILESSLNLGLFKDAIKKGYLQTYKPNESNAFEPYVSEYGISITDEEKTKAYAPKAAVIAENQRIDALERLNHYTYPRSIFEPDTKTSTPVRIDELVGYVAAGLVDQRELETAVKDRIILSLYSGIESEVNLATELVEKYPKLEIPRQKTVLFGDVDLVPILLDNTKREIHSPVLDRIINQVIQRLPSRLTRSGFLDQSDVIRIIQTVTIQAEPEPLNRKLYEGEIRRILHDPVFS